MDVVYFDISKAFDTVTHPKLILKRLAAYGFEGNILSFISDFVEGRSQRVVLPKPSGVSSWRSLGSGVPQIQIQIQMGICRARLTNCPGALTNVRMLCETGEL